MTKRHPCGVGYANYAKAIHVNRVRICRAARIASTRFLRELGNAIYIAFLNKRTNQKMSRASSPRHYVSSGVDLAFMLFGYRRKRQRRRKRFPRRYTASAIFKKIPGDPRSLRTLYLSLGILVKTK